MRCYAITLLSRADRLANVQHLMECAPEIVDVEIVPAVVPGDDLEQQEDYDAGFRVAHFGYHLTTGELGCFRSHRSVWEIISQNKNDQISCVLEDDVVLSEGFTEAIETAISWKHCWDVCRLHQACPSRLGVAIRSNDRYRLWYPLIPARGTAAYLIKPEAAGVLLQKSKMIRYPVDHFFDDPRQHPLRVLDLTPGGVTIRAETPSMIGVRGWDEQTLGRRSLYRMAQRDWNNLSEQAARAMVMKKILAEKLFSSLLKKSVV